MPERQKLSWIIALLALSAVIWMLGHSLLTIDWAAVSKTWSSIPTRSITASLAGSLLSFSMLAMLEVIASRWVAPQRVSASLAAFAGAVSHAFSNTLGFPAVTGGVVRYRIYATVGLGKGDIARIVTLAGVGVAMGFAMVTTLALLWQPKLALGWGRPLGAGVLIMLLAFLAWSGRKPRSLRFIRWKLDVPDAATAAAQMIVGGVEMTAAIGALYVLLPASIAPPFIDFLPVYVGAVVAGLVSHVPGGLGVFEVIVLAAFPAHARAAVLAAMLCYRLTYSLVPFTLASVAFVIFEARRPRERTN